MRRAERYCCWVGYGGDNAADTGPAMKIALALGCDNSCYPPISWRRQQHSAAPTITKATIVVQTLDNAYAVLHLSCAPVGEVASKTRPNDCYWVPRVILEVVAQCPLRH